MVSCAVRVLHEDSKLLTCTAMAKDVDQLLRSTTLRHIFEAPRAIIAFEHDTPISTVLEVLSSNKVLSAPIVVRPDGSEKHKAALSGALVQAMLGFVGVSDILRLLLNEAGNMDSNGSGLEVACSALCYRPVSVLFSDGAIGHARAPDLADACQDWGMKGYLDASLLSVLRSGFLSSPGSVPLPGVAEGVVHRLAVFDCNDQQEDGSTQLRGIYSQSDFVEFIHANAAALGELGGRTLRQLGLLGGAPVSPSRTCSAARPAAKQHAGAKVVSLQEDMCTWEAFKELQRRGVSGAVVVSPPPALTAVGNLSKSDARCLAPGLFWTLALPLREFLRRRPLLTAVQQETAQLDGEGMLETSTASLRPDMGPDLGSGPALVACGPDSTFLEAVEKLVRSRVHRIYVLDTDRRPVGVMTLSDVCRIVSDACGP